VTAMTLTELKDWIIRHRHTADPKGFGYSRDNRPASTPVPEGVALYFFTGRDRKQAHR
jgi:hypothetical protein